MTAKQNTASIHTRYCCVSCGWPIIHCCCNDEMSRKKPFREWDYWWYCSNKACEYHVGTGVFQSTPDFAALIK